MKPYPSIPSRFDLDGYLDRQLAANQPEVVEHYPGVVSMMFDSKGGGAGKRIDDMPEEFALGEAGGACAAPSRFRGWAVRLNDRCELWLERFDWRRVDVWLTKLTAVTVTGALLWLAYITIDAWMQGRFQIGGQ